MASSPQASCLSDPNFAVICAFLERFANSCGITYPTFTDLQEMLENSEQVPQELADLHIKLLRKARKTVFIEKWEKALIKFCHTYSSQDGWEIERFGYKKSRLEVKLRALKMLLEGQFDLNSKFKSSINSLESEELRSKPLGRDNMGRIYWLQFDPVSNIRVYREDLDEESWTLVAQDRPSLVSLLQELSGDKFPLDLNLLMQCNANNAVENDKPSVDTGQGDEFTVNNDDVTCDNRNLVELNSSVDVKEEIENNQNSEEKISENVNCLTNGVNGQMSVKEECKIELSERDSTIKTENGTSESIVKSSENIEDNLGDGTIEEPVMYITGEGDGQDCMTGNPDREETEKESEKSGSDNIPNVDQMIHSVQNPSECHANSEKLKSTPKLWTIDTICGVKDEKKSVECLSTDNKSDGSDLKMKQKYFCTFSIESVLDKKDVSSSKNAPFSHDAGKCDSVTGSTVFTHAECSISESVKTPEQAKKDCEALVVDNSDNCSKPIALETITSEAGECKAQKVVQFSENSNLISNEKIINSGNVNEVKEISQKESNSSEDSLSSTLNITDEKSNTADTHSEMSEKDEKNSQGVLEAEKEIDIKIGEESSHTMKSADPEKVTDNVSEINEMPGRAEQNVEEDKNIVELKSSKETFESTETDKFDGMEKDKEKKDAEKEEELFSKRNENVNEEVINPSGEVNDRQQSIENAKVTEDEQKNSDDKREEIKPGTKTEDVTSELKGNGSSGEEMKSVGDENFTTDNEVPVQNLTKRIEEPRIEDGLDSEMRPEPLMESKTILSESVEEKQQEDSINVKEVEDLKKKEDDVENKIDQNNRIDNENEKVDEAQNNCRNEREAEKLDEALNDKVDEKQGKLDEALSEKVDEKEGKLDEALNEKVDEKEGKLDEALNEKVDEKQGKLDEALNEKIDEKEGILVEAPIEKVDKNEGQLDEAPSDKVNEKEEKLVEAPNEKIDEKEERMEIEETNQGLDKNKICDDKMDVKEDAKPSVAEPEEELVKHKDQEIVQDEVQDGKEGVQPNEVESEIQEDEVEHKETENVLQTKDVEGGKSDHEEEPENEMAEKVQQPKQDSISTDDEIKGALENVKEGEIRPEEHLEEKCAEAEVKSYQENANEGEEQVKVVEAPLATSAKPDDCPVDKSNEKTEKISQTGSVVTSDDKTPMDVQDEQIQPEEEKEDVAKVHDSSKDESESQKMDDSNQQKENVSSRVLSRNRPSSLNETNSDQSAQELNKTKTRRRSKALESNDLQEGAEPQDVIGGETKDVAERCAKETSDDTSPPLEEDKKSEKEEDGEEEEDDDEEKANEDQVDEKVASPKGKKKHFRRRRRGRNRWTARDKNSSAKMNAKKEQSPGEDNEDGGNKEENEPKMVKRKGRPKKEDSANRLEGRQMTREIKLLGITNEDGDVPTVRQSRRIAQIKMKEEAERRQAEALQLETFKKTKKPGKSPKSRKSKKNADSDSYDDKEGPDADDSDDDDDEKAKGFAKDKRSKRGRKKKDKLVFNELNPWASSSGSSTADDEEEELEEEPHEDEELVFKSDHEFSPESDVEDPDYKPIKRARTAKVEESKEEPGKYDDTSCENCGKNDHPEWILLCDKCDKGWHASCVRPALMVVPEGDWFCPPCEHIALMTKLQESLVQYDRCLKQREIEETRKKRLAFVGISLDNVLPPAKKSSSKNEEETDVEEGSGSGSGSESESESESASESEDEPIYQLRQRRSNVTSYRYNEYDELIKSALQDEIEAVKGAGNAGKGKDISNIVNAEKQRRQEEENDEDGRKGQVRSTEEDEPEGDSVKKEVGTAVRTESDGKEKPGRDKTYDAETEDEEEDNDEDEEEEANFSDEIPPVVSKSSKKKKSKSVKITSLDFTSEEEDHNSDSDFKGGSSEEESDYSLPSESESSGGRRRKGGDGPLRRSARARTSRYDRDFINDDSDDSPKRKRNRRDWDSTESSDSDRSWGRRKRKSQKSYGRSSAKKSRSKSKKKKQRRRSIESDDEECLRPKKQKNRKIKYGGLDSLDEDTVLTKRTRGKKINYQEIAGSDSDDNGQSRKARPSRVIESDDDFVAENEKEEEEGQDAESEEMEESFEEEDEEEDDSNQSDSAKDKRTSGKGKISKDKSDKQVQKTNKKKKKKKKWVIPDPDDFSENDLMEDEQLDKFTEELEELNEDEEEILGNMLESGDVPIHELKAAVKRAKEESKSRREDETKANVLEDPGKVAEKTATVASTRPELPAGSGKFPKIGKVKITPSRAELAQMGVHAQQVPAGKPKAFMQTEGKNFMVDNASSVKGPDGSGFLMKSLQGNLKPGNLIDPNIPMVNHSFPASKPPFAPFPVESGSSLNNLMMMKPDDPTIRPSVSEFGGYQEILPANRMHGYPPTIPATVPAMSNLECHAGAKAGPPPLGPNVKRKREDGSSESEGGSALVTDESPVPDEFAQMKSVDSPPKKKGRGRGKKQLMPEGQGPAQVKHGVGLPGPVASETGSVITRILNSPQGNQVYSGGDPTKFAAAPRTRPLYTGPPTLAPHFPTQAARPVMALRLRPPGPGAPMFRMSHPHDPSPSGGGAINIPMGKPVPGPPLPAFSKIPGLPAMPPRFVPADPTPRQVFPAQAPGTRPEFPFGPYYGEFGQPGGGSAPPGLPFQSGAPFPQHFPGEPMNPKQHDVDEVGGEFGGLASYFASQREDDLDT